MPTLTRIRKIFGKLRDPETLLVTVTIASVILGAVFGVIIRVSTKDLSREAIALVGFPGEILMNMLKMLIIPLIVSSLVTGLTGLDSKSTGKMGAIAIVYYIFTTLMAVVLGIILVCTIKPGRFAESESVDRLRAKARPGTLYAFLDLIRNLFPANIFQATMQQTQSVYKNKTMWTKTNESDPTSYEKYLETVISPSTISGTNVLGIVTFSIWFGLILNQLGHKAIIMVDFFVALNEVIMRMVKLIMWYSPIGIFFLIVGKILEIEDLEKTAASLGMYMLTVILGLLIHSTVTLALLYYLITRRNPLTFFKGMLQAWVTALGTASSAATLPITYKCLEENLGIDKRVTRFVLPIGATINMDGTALYEAVASIFIAQINNRPLSIFNVFTISITATLAAIGAASVPSAGLVTMILVLTAVGLPTKDITVIIAVDWLLDRIRTSINVLGDAFGAGIVSHLCRESLAEKDKEIHKELEMANINVNDGEFANNESGVGGRRLSASARAMLHMQPQTGNSSGDGGSVEVRVSQRMQGGNPTTHSGIQEEEEDIRPGGSVV